VRIIFKGEGFPLPRQVVEVTPFDRFPYALFGNLLKTDHSARPVIR
jgi:hypothetical protein